MAKADLIHISLTNFGDFVCKAGTSKVAHIKSLKKVHALGYSPRRDFYKALREGIVRFHKEERPRSWLDALARGANDAKKRTAYPAVIEGYKRFLGRKKIGWFDPPRDVWVYRTLGVSVNPEIGLNFNGVRHVIKLYFKKDEVGRQQIRMITQLMQSVLRKKGRSESFCILDVRRSALVESGSLNPDLTVLLQGEALNFIRMYNNIEI